MFILQKFEKVNSYAILKNTCDDNMIGNRITNAA